MLRVVGTLCLGGLLIAMSLSTPAVHAASCQGKGAEEGVCEDQVNIGSSVVLVGPLARWGNNLARVGPRAYFNMVNERGGIHGRKINYIIYDDSYRPERALANVKKLIDRDRVFCIFLQTGTDTTKASYRYVVEAKGVPLMFPASGSHFWTSPFKPRVFPLPPSLAMQTYILIDYFVITKGLSKIGIFYQDDPMGYEVLTPARQRLKEHGLSPVGEERLESTEFDVSAQLMKLRNRGAEAVVLGVPYNFALRFMREAKKMDWGAQLGGVGLTGTQALLDMAGDMAQGYVNVMTMPDARHAPGPAMEEYRNRLRQYSSGASYDSSTLTGWWASDLLVEILRRTGRDLSRESMIRAAEGIRDYDTGITPPISFYPNDHSGSTAGYIAVAMPADSGSLRFLPLGPDSRGPAPGGTAKPFWVSSWGRSVADVTPLFKSLRVPTQK